MMDFSHKDLAAVLSLPSVGCVIIVVVTQIVSLGAHPSVFVISTNIITLDMLMKNRSIKRIINT